MISAFLWAAEPATSAKAAPAAGRCRERLHLTFPDLPGAAECRRVGAEIAVTSNYLKPREVEKKGLLAPGS